MNIFKLKLRLVSIKSFVITTMKEVDFFYVDCLLIDIVNC